MDPVQKNCTALDWISSLSVSVLVLILIKESSGVKFSQAQLPVNLPTSLQLLMKGTIKYNNYTIKHNYKYKQKHKYKHK